ncbi:MAG: cobalamin-binding protein, partial [Chloroflexi bacterium]|nr:cobalamin-binding protein [Chloroflexota bacterium]
IYKVRSRSASAESTPRVACIEWLEPMIVAGHWVPELVEMAGGVDVLAEPGQPSRRITMDDLRNADPDVLVLMPCGMGVQRGLAEVSALDNRGEWEELRSVRDGRVYMADAGAYFSRSGPRLVDALELLGQIVHPEIFDKPLQDDAAVRLERFPTR